MKANLIIVCFVLYFVQQPIKAEYANATRSYDDADFIKQGPVSLFWTQLRQRLPSENEISKVCKQSLEALIVGLDEGKTWSYRSNYSFTS